MGKTSMTKCKALTGSAVKGLISPHKFLTNNLIMYMYLLWPKIWWW